MEKDDVMTESKVHDALVDYNRLYTYSDYLKWDDDKRRELIDGVPYLMAMPSLPHQAILLNLAFQVKSFLKGKPCKVHLPLDVRLNADTLDNTVVQPDLIIVCDHSIENNAGIKGVPDMVVEILSPSTSRYDRNLKFHTYKKVGVKEYWIIDPEDKTLAAHIHKDNEYITRPYTDEETAPVHVLEGFTIDLSEVFSD